LIRVNNKIIARKAIRVEAGRQISTISICFEGREKCMMEEKRLLVSGTDGPGMTLAWTVPTGGQP
jgi:hypothetical protein